MTKTVMVIDDSSIIRQIMRSSFEHAGYEVIEAADGQRAVQLLDGRRFAAVICDMAMPSLDGLGFVKAMRAMHNYKFTPVVMMTTESREEKKAEAKKLGVHAWANKPCPPSELVQLVKRLSV